MFVPALSRLPQVLEREEVKNQQPDAILRQVAAVGIELPGLDSNQDKENQNLLCYRYTTGYRVSLDIRIASGDGRCMMNTRTEER